MLSGKGTGHALLLAFAILVWGCQGSGGPGPTATHTARPTAASATPPPKASPTPTQPAPPPELTVQILALNPPDRHGQHRVIGLVTNKSSAALGAIDLQVSLRDAGGQVVAQERAALWVDPLLPGESSPFCAALPAQVAPSGATVEIIHFQPADPAAEVLVPRVERATQDTLGRTLVLGALHNQGPDPVSIRSLRLLAWDGGGEWALVGERTLHPGWVPPGDRQPFLAILPGFPEDGKLAAYVRSGPMVASPTRVELSAHPQWLRDAQGNLFLLGSLVNPSPSPQPSQGLLEISGPQGTLSLSPVGGLVPLAAGESLPFSVSEFHGLSPATLEATDAGAGLRVRYIPNLAPPWWSAIRRRPLVAQIELIEPLGSGLVLRGTMRNPLDIPVAHPTVILSMTDSQGRLRAASMVQEAALGPGDTAPFVTLLRLPVGTDPVELEFDLHTVGIIFAPQPWR